MKLRITETPLSGVVVIDIDYLKDARGFFVEPWHERDFAEAGLNLRFVQEGHSRSGLGVLRGLHYQDMSAPMGKLVRCTLGTIFDVAVDLWVNSPTFSKWFSIELSADNKTQIYIPPRLAQPCRATAHLALGPTAPQWGRTLRAKRAPVARHPRGSETASLCCLAFIRPRDGQRKKDPR